MTKNIWTYLDIAENGWACNDTDDENGDDDGKESNGMALTLFWLCLVSEKDAFVFESAQYATHNLFSYIVHVSLNKTLNNSNMKVFCSAYGGSKVWLINISLLTFIFICLLFKMSSITGFCVILLGYFVNYF